MDFLPSIVSNILKKLKHIVKHSYSTTELDDGNTFYNTQIKCLDTITQTGVYFPYGYYAKTPANVPHVTLTVQLQDENQVSLPYDPYTRFQGLNAGEVMVGNQLAKVSIKFLNDGSVEIFTKSQCKIIGDLIVTGNITDNSDTNTKTMADVRTAYNPHTHLESGGGTTGAPTPPI